MSGTEKSQEPIYYRSEEFDPKRMDNVFSKGLKTQTSIDKSATGNWLNAALLHQSGSPVITDSNLGVCITTNLRSAALFPNTINHNYPADYIMLYIIGGLPLSVQPSQADKKTSIVDLHQTQVAEIANDPKLPAGVLMAYESMTGEIPNGNIVGALKIERKAGKEDLKTSKVYINYCSSDPAPKKILEKSSLANRECRPVEFFLNPHCNLDETLKAELVQQGKAMIGGEFSSTPLSYGFGGKSIEAPIPISLFWSEKLENLVADVNKAKWNKNPTRQNTIKQQLPETFDSLIEEQQKLLAAEQHQLQEHGLESSELHDELTAVGKHLYDIWKYAEELKLGIKLPSGLYEIEQVQRTITRTPNM